MPLPYSTAWRCLALSFSNGMFMSTPSSSATATINRWK
jgi:hypothetical protein